MSDAPPTPEPVTERTPTINEDWAATVVGLLLLALILSGVISEGVLQ